MATVRQIMKSKVLTVPSSAKLADAARLLVDHRVGGAPVVNDEGAVVGFVSDPDLFDIVFDTNARQAPVTQYMSRHVQAVAPNDSLSTAAELLALYSFNRLPVVEDGRLVGLITRRDLIEHAIQANETLREPLMDLIPALAPLS